MCGCSSVPLATTGTRWPIREEVAAAHHFRHVLRAPDKRDEVEGRVHRAAKHALTAERAADGGDRYEAADPRHRSIQPAGDPPAGILLERSGYRHASVTANRVPYSGSA